MKAHEILGVPEGAGKDEIKRAYRKKAFEFHPDKNASEDAHKKFIEATEAYEELAEGKRRKSSYTNTHPYTYEDMVEMRRRNFHERAEYYANLKYEEFKAETDAFKRSWYYWISVSFNFLIFGFLYLLSFILIVSPLILIIASGNPFMLFVGIITVSLGIAIFNATRAIYTDFTPYLREKDYDLEKERETARNQLDPGEEKAKHPYKIPYVNFRKYKLAKFSLAVPLLLALVLTFDILLPLTEKIQTIENIEVIHKSHRTRYGGVTRWSINKYYTEDLKFEPEYNFAKVGDRLKVKYTPLLKKVKYLQRYDNETGNFYDEKTGEDMYTGIFFFIIVLFLLVYLGLAASFENEISAAVIISYLICIGLYYFALRV